jgi:GWxTD domain-containing protein
MRSTNIAALMACVLASMPNAAQAQTTPTAASRQQQAPTAQPQLGVQHDVVITRTSELDSRARADIYVAVPYELLAFQNADGRYAAKYRATITLRDAASRKVYDTVVTRRIVEGDFSVTRGSTGKVDNIARTTRLSPGTYRLDVIINDDFAKREYTATRSVTVADYTRDYPTVAGLLFVREIEQRGDRYRISPIVGDMIHQPEAPLFVFFEAYLDVAPATFGFSWALLNASGERVASAAGGPVEAVARTMQSFLPVRTPERLVPGMYNLAVHIHPVVGGTVDTSKTLGSGTRSIGIPRSTMGDALSDLTKAIRQLRYVATQDEISNIEAGATQGERLARFEEFWRKLDPTPNTARNEAFDEYYARIQHANAKFKSYAEGWLTDMGMVHIIYGQPTNADRFQMQNGMSVRIVWTYPNGFAVTFDDNTGFGDFRLRTPLPAGARFTYRR